MSLWVDDITLSGDAVPSRVIWSIKRAIHEKGLRYHKVRITALRRRPVATGHQVSSCDIAPANKHHVKVRDALRELDRTIDRASRLALIQSLIGQTNHARLIYSVNHPVRARLNSRRDWLHQEHRMLQQASFITYPSKPIPTPRCDEISVPWAAEETTAHALFIKQLQVEHRSLLA
jgi:RNA-directed DNA polymerase